MTIPTDEQDRADTAAFYARLGLSPEGYPPGLTFDNEHEPDAGPAVGVQVADAADDPLPVEPAESGMASVPTTRSLRVPAARVSTTDTLAQILGTFALGETVPQSEVIETLEAFGLTFSRDTLHKARKRAGLVTRRVYNGRHGHWVWTRPALNE